MVSLAASQQEGRIKGRRIKRVEKMDGWIEVKEAFVLFASQCAGQTRGQPPHDITKDLFLPKCV